MAAHVHTYVKVYSLYNTSNAPPLLLNIVTLPLLL